MARLVIKTPEPLSRALELKLGANRLGRSPDCDFQLEHPTVSSVHCQIILGDNELVVRDCGSTNGTFVNGEPASEARLLAGQTLRLGDVELLVESTEVTIAIPPIEVPIPAPPVVLPDGSTLCRRHPETRATHQCTHCHELLCPACVTRLRRQGGKAFYFCSLCSHPVQRLGPEPKRKKSLLDFLQKTVKLPFLRRSKRT
jgi:pSer/pThr/pTyr-binding forkhead associated (FHA) protein